MISQRSAFALLAVTLALGCAGPAFSEDDAKAGDSAKSSKKAEVKSSDTETITESAGSGSGREGNWKKHAQGAPSLKVARKRVETEPKSADAHNDLGWALRQNGKLEEAETELKKAIELDDKIPYGHSNLSVVYLDTNRVGDAVKEAERAVSIDDKSPIFRVVYGNALSADGKLDEAIKQYNQAIVLRADYENAHYNLGRVLHLQGKNAEASGALSQALKLDPNDRRVVDLLDKLLTKDPEPKKVTR